MQGPKEQGPRCSTSYAAPFVDLSAVATIAVLLSTALADSCDDNTPGCLTDAVVSPVALVGGLFAASTVYGGVVVRGCNRHREQMSAQVASMIENLIAVAEAGACEEVRRAVLVAEEISAELGVKYALTNRAVLRCIVGPPPEPPATSGT